MAAKMLPAVVSQALPAAAAPDDAKSKPHHLQDGKGFHNPWASYRDFKPYKIIWWMIMRRLSGQSHTPDTTPPTVPVQKPAFLPSRETAELRATWLGHACFLVEFPGGFRVLFDPVFTDRCSPFSYMGPARYTEPPCTIADIPTVDAVVISHSHYDHLSYPTVLEIAKTHPEAHFFVPLGNKSWFEGTCGIHSVTEMDWWETREIRIPRAQAMEASDKSPTTEKAEVEDVAAVIGCLPSQHTSARTPWNKNKTLWASWSIESGGKKVYFAGDTGYRSVEGNADGKDDVYDEEFGHLPHCPAFAQIGDLRGPFDLGLIPIGAYTPRSVMSPMHANPTDSVHIFRDTKCERALGMHWGTWVLTEEDVMEPPKLLKQALAKQSIAEHGVFDVCDIGESCEIPGADSRPPA